MLYSLIVSQSYLVTLLLSAIVKFKGHSLSRLHHLSPPWSLEQCWMGGLCLVIRWSVYRDEDSESQTAGFRPWHDHACHPGKGILSCMASVHYSSNFFWGINDTIQKCLASNLVCVSFLVSAHNHSEKPEVTMGLVPTLKIPFMLTRTVNPRTHCIHSLFSM